MPEDSYAYVVANFQAPPLPDYVPGPEELEQVPPLSEFVPEPVYLEFMPPEDEILPAEEQPLPATESPTADLPRYILESDPEEDPTDYPTEEGDDDELPDDDKDDDDDDVEEDEEEEEVHPASADSIPPPPVHRVTARMSIREHPPTPVFSEAEIDMLLAIPSPPPFPLSPWSSPLPQIPSPLLPVSPPLPSCYDMAESQYTIYLPFITIRYTPSGTPPLLPIPLPTSSPPQLLPFTSHTADVLEVTLPPQKRLCIALGQRYEIGESSSTAAARPTGGYEITDTWDEMLVGMPGAPATDDTELGRRMMDFTTTVRQDTDEIYGRLDDAQDDKALICGRVNMLYKDRRDHAWTARLIETEARLSHQAWVQSMDASDLARSEVMALRT
nr:hypothetical protein [Tanacetum cinerariifolium]